MDESDRRQHRLGTLLYALSGVICGIGLAISASSQNWQTQNQQA